MQPEAIPAGALTHINLAFIQFDDTYKLVDTGGDIVARVSKLKLRYPGLRVNIAVGGWNFNDPPTRLYFSQMANNYDSRQTFISSVMAYLTKYGLDGIDIDWEYPAASDRGGIPADTDAYVELVADMRQAFDGVNPGWEITCTLPSSYWYLQNFNLPSMQKYVSWFNMMSYDLHGMWDQLNKYTGPQLQGHTNLTQIDQGFQLLWRVGVDPAKVVMGMGFYGRSFTMADSSCWQPWCQFSTAGNPGDCSGTAGILYYAEIASSNESLNVATYYDPVTTVKVNVFNGNQWISYDDEQSWADKLAYLTGHCISGVMIWAIDQDTGQYDALAGLLGGDAAAGALLEGGSLSDAQKKRLAAEFGAYTGQDCFVTPKCNDGKTDYGGDTEYYCPSGYTAVSTAHEPLQRPDYYIGDSCPEGSFRYICCPTSAMPKNCAWNGAPVRSEIGCSGFCGADQFQLNVDTYVDAAGEEPCYQGQRALCCDNTEVLNQCHWSGCQGPTTGVLTCPSGFTLMTSRYDDGTGKLCSVSAGHGTGVYVEYQQAFCCPDDDAPQNCGWTFELGTTYDPQKVCLPTVCPATMVKYTTALDPPNAYKDVTSLGGVDCSAYQTLPDQDPNWSYCCDPPEDYNGKWPVDPSYLWASPDEEKGADILWAYQDNYGSNDGQSKPGGDAYGDDPYGFVMLDGPPGSVDGSFASSYTVARSLEHEAAAAAAGLVKRSLLTANRTRIETAFEYASEVLYVFCNYPDDSPRCRKLFLDGAEDTIIKLPDHVGEGPFARVVSIQPAPAHYTLPRHHLRKRAAQELGSTVWRMEIDYEFGAIKRSSGPVNMRVDFTNMLDYWEDVTDTPAKARRELRDSQSLAYHEWRHKVRRAKSSHDRMRKRQADIMSGGVTRLDERDNELLGSESPRAKRWFGSFINWIAKVTTVEKSDAGFLTMAVQKSILLYRAFVGCSRTNAHMSIYLDAEAAMDATYAYYYAGALGGVVPTATYAYFAMQPHIYLGLTVTGGARLEYRSPRAKLLPTLSYPGLAIKGLAAVGPTLDVWGQIVGVVQISGTMQAGARYTFEQAEMYWPDDGAAAPVLQGLVGDTAEPVASGLVPEFQAAVSASVDLDINVTPEARLGIQIGGGSAFGVTLVDAQVVGYVNNTLRFHADATGTASSSTGSAEVAYNYGVYLLYNVGYGGWASIVGYTWNVQSRNLFSDPKTITLYHNGDVLSTTFKRDVPLLAGRSLRPELKVVDGNVEDLHLQERGILNGDTDGSELGETETVLARARIVGMDGDVLWTSGEDMINVTLPRRGLAKRQASEAETNDDGQSPDFSLGTLTCPPDSCSSNSGGSAKRATSNTCGWVLPDLRYSSNFFGDQQLFGYQPGQQAITKGIATNVQNFFTGRQIPLSGSSSIALTWDPAGQNARRDFACSVPEGTFGTSYCAVDNYLLSAQLGIPAGDTIGFTSCDEFPFASSEEGGKYFGTQGVGATSVSTLCVPTWQQTLQGKCNGLMGGVQTNVNYFDDPTAAVNWQVWGAAGTSRTAMAAGGTNPDWFSGGWQREALYDFRIPQANGISNAFYGPDAQGRYGGYFLRRNFTMGLAAPSAANTAWGAQNAASWSSATGGVTGSTDATAIACAVNTFAQPNIYQQPSPNALCWTGAYSDNPVFGSGGVPSFRECSVIFSGPTPSPNSKRGLNASGTADDEDGDDAIVGTFNGWGVKSESN